MESLRVPNGAHTLIEACASITPSSEYPKGRLIRVLMFVDASPSWIPFGSLIDLEDQTHIRVQEREGDPGQLVKLVADIIDVSPKPVKPGTPLIELVGGGIFDGTRFTGEEAVRYPRLKDGEVYRIGDATFIELPDRPDDDRRLVFAGMRPADV